jgi:hypothetical protein
LHQRHDSAAALGGHGEAASIVNELTAVLRFLRQGTHDAHHRHHHHL